MAKQLKHRLNARPSSAWSNAPDRETPSAMSAGGGLPYGRVVPNQSQAMAREACQYRDTWARMPRWFNALAAILARVLTGSLRSWSASTLLPLFRGAVVAVCYFVFAKASLTLASLHPSASPVWPPSGLALASLLLWGNGLWPAIAAGAFLANASTFGSLSTSSLIAVGNTLEAVITAALLKRLKTSTRLFEDAPQVVLFAFLTLLPGTMISATMGVGSLVLAGFADLARFPSIWLTWWLGDAGGKLLVTPFIVLWAKSSLQEVGRAELQNLGLLLGATIIVGIVAFSPLLNKPLRAVRWALSLLGRCCGLRCGTINETQQPLRSCYRRSRSGEPCQTEGRLRGRI